MKIRSHLRLPSPWTVVLGGFLALVLPWPAAAQRATFVAPASAPLFAEECDGTELLPLWEYEHGPRDDRDFMLSSRWRDNVGTAQGLCEIRMRKETRLNKSWTSGHIWSRQEFLYGYFEARLRFAQASGIDNAFWLMSFAPPGDDPAAPACEIDIVEGAFPALATNNLHHYWKGDRRFTQKVVPFTPEQASTFNVYAVHWTREFIRWYWNGTLVREEANQACHRPLAVHLSTAVVRKFMGPVTDAIDGSVMAVDYVRVHATRPAP